MDPFSEEDPEIDLPWDWLLSSADQPPEVSAPPPPQPTSFLRYETVGGPSSSSSSSSHYGPHAMSFHKRMIEFIRNRIAAPKPEGDHKEYKSSRGFRQMMRERQRRERLSQGYADLHSILPATSISKGTKNSIAEAAVVYARELKELMEGLVRRNDELNEEIARDEGKGELKFNISVPNASTGIESLIETLRCLKDLDVKANSIRSEFCGQEGFLVVGVDDSKEAVTEIQSTVESVMEKWKDGN